MGNGLARQYVSVVVPDTHTFAINNSFSTIDVLLTQRPEHFDEIVTFPPLSTSDHLPVLYCLNTKFTIQETKHKHFNYKLADRKGYRTHLFDTIPPLKFLRTLQDLKDALETLTTAIRQSATVQPFYSVLCTSASFPTENAEAHYTSDSNTL
jgi:hypothetical protein